MTGFSGASWRCHSFHAGVQLYKAYDGFQRGQLSYAYVVYMPMVVWLELLSDSAQQVWRILKFIRVRQWGLWVNKEGLYVENPDAQEACICTHCHGIIWRNYLTSLLHMVSNPSAPMSGSFLYRITYVISSH